MATPNDQNIEDIIFGGESADVQPNLEILMEQYKLFVEASERLVARRQVVNTFFLSANALALSALGLIVKEVAESPLVALELWARSERLSTPKKLSGAGPNPFGPPLPNVLHSRRRRLRGPGTRTTDYIDASPL